MQLSEGFGESAQMYYMWGAWEAWSEEAKHWCVQGADGECMSCTEEDENCQDGLAVAQLAWDSGLWSKVLF